MAIQFKEFKRQVFSGALEELKSKVVEFCNSEIRGFRIISISEAKGMSDDFFRITVWYDDEVEKYEILLKKAVSDAEE